LKTARKKSSSPPALSRECDELRTRLTEAEDTLRAIRNGEVDAVVVAGKEGDQVFTLEGAGDAYRLLIESMNEGALTLTMDKVILYANECFARMVQCPLEQVTGSFFHRFLSPEDRVTFRALLDGDDQAGAKIQVLLNIGDGSQMPVQISIRPLLKSGFNGATLGMVVTDMTEARRIAHQKETERLYAQVVEHAAQLERRVDERTSQLLHANRELEAFESSVSHDLRSPLRHITGFSDILIADFASQLSEQAQGYLRKICANAGKMERLIVAMLEFSRMSKRSLSPEAVDVSRMWREILTEMTPELGDRRVDVAIEDLPSCWADPTLLRQVLINLLGNALKYSRKRDCSVIVISSVAQSDGGSPAYSIKDNGVGFAMADSAKLFRVFERLHHARDFEGTGVGLSTVQRIIQRHGGRIWAESEPNAGATFFFTVGPRSGSAFQGAA
jgi:PAS domain S-box-containing protein